MDEGEEEISSMNFHAGHGIQKGRGGQRNLQEQENMGLEGRMKGYRDRFCI